jgi:hypothetical protein
LRRPKLSTGKFSAWKKKINACTYMHPLCSWSSYGHGLRRSHRNNEKSLFISAVSENVAAVLPDHFAHVRNPLSSKN